MARLQATAAVSPSPKLRLWAQDYRSEPSLGIWIVALMSGRGQDRYRHRYRSAVGRAPDLGLVLGLGPPRGLEAWRCLAWFGMRAWARRKWPLE